jgi:hypothetical protein
MESEAAAMRHLLQGADPIPVFAEIDQRMSVSSFFDEYLVNSGPFETYSVREKNFEVLDRRCQWDEERLQLAIDRAVLSRTKEIRALSAFSKIAETYTLFDQQTDQSRFETEQVFVGVMLEDAMPRKIRAHRSMNEYTRDPDYLGRDFSLFLQEAEAAVTSNGYFFPCVVFGLLTCQFDFARFRQLRTDLPSLDETLRETIETKGNELIR